jgi:hypothetical protein
MHRSGPQILDSGLSEIFMPVQAARLSASRVKYTDDDELEFLESLRQTARPIPEETLPRCGWGGRSRRWGLWRSP